MKWLKKSLTTSDSQYLIFFYGKKSIIYSDFLSIFVSITKKRDRHFFLEKWNNLYSGYYPQKKKPATFLPYVKYKLETERYLLNKAHREHNFPLVILRPGDVFGPYDRTTCIHLLKGIEDRVPTIVGHGKWIFGYCYVENLCMAILLACETKNIEGRAYTITNDSEITWKDLFSIFLKRLNKKQRIYIPVTLAYLVAFSMKIIHLIVPSFKPSVTFYRIRRITSHTSYDISRTIKELKYAPDKNIVKQLNSVVDWYLAEKAAGYIK